MSAYTVQRGGRSLLLTPGQPPGRADARIEHDVIYSSGTSRARARAHIKYSRPRDRAISRVYGVVSAAAKRMELWRDVAEKRRRLGFIVWWLLAVTGRARTRPVCMCTPRWRGGKTAADGL